MVLETVLATLGFAILALRLGPLLRRPVVRETVARGGGRVQGQPPSGILLPKFREGFPSLQGGAGEPPLVSIIVPARNEAANLPRLLESLLALDHSSREIIVVDDHSEDETAAIARRFGVKVLPAPGRPEGWSGKNWACWNGALAARGSYFLFTDADTIHYPPSLAAALEELGASGMLSSIPDHRTASAWERAAGIFPLLVLLSTAALQQPRSGRLFAIGQYLLFRRDAYEALGGHAAVPGSCAEDIDLARRAIGAGLGYKVVTRRPLFAVRMYPDFRSFIAGWRRIFRLGLPRSRNLAFLEITLVFMALTGTGRFFATAWLAAITGASLALLFFAQKRHGDFSIMGVILYPFSMFLFAAVTVLALADLCGGREVVWRGRRYSAAVERGGS